MIVVGPVLPVLAILVAKLLAVILPITAVPLSIFLPGAAILLPTLHPVAQVVTAITRRRPIGHAVLNARSLIRQAIPDCATNCSCTGCRAESRQSI